MIIKNGVGDGTLAEVFSNHHLAVKSINEDMIGYESRVNEQAFTISSPVAWTVGTSARSIMVVANNETEKSFIVNKLFVFNNGGSTSHNRVIQGSMYKNSTLPTTNIYASTAIPLGNLNLGSSKVTSVVAYIWDGASTGLDGTKGDLAMNGYFSQGATVIDIASTLVISPSQIIRFDMLGEEDTKCLFALSGFLCEC